MIYLQVKNWKDFQHYKDRNPSWIKLHKNLLDDYDYQRLPIASKALAPMLWLLASENLEGKIEYNKNKLGFRLRLSEKDLEQAIKPLIEKGFFIMLQDASNSLAECYQDAMPEKRREETYSKEKEKSIDIPDFLNIEILEGYFEMRKLMKKPMTQKAKTNLIKKLNDFYTEGIDPNECLTEATNKNWLSVYKPKNNNYENNTGNNVNPYRAPNYGGKPSTTEQVSRAIAELQEEFRSGKL